MIGIGAMAIVVIVCYQPALKKFGDIPVLSLCIYLALFCCAVRSFAAPINKYWFIAATAFNQVGNATTDPAFISFASMSSTPRSRGKILGIF